jgi:hypothetical protein
MVGINRQARITLTAEAPRVLYADPVSPTVAITVAERLLTGTVPVRWSGSDTGSGLAGYDLLTPLGCAGRWGRVGTAAGRSAEHELRLCGGAGAPLRIPGAGDGLGEQHARPASTRRTPGGCKSCLVDHESPSLCAPFMVRASGRT